MKYRNNARAGKRGEPVRNGAVGGGSDCGAYKPAKWRNICPACLNDIV